MSSYYQTNKEQHLESCKKWREKNPDKVSKNTQKFYQTHPDYNKQYYQEHKEELQIKQKQYREEHLGTKKEYNAEYYQNNKEKAKQNAERWRKANKDKRKESDAKYYQKKKQQALEKKMIEFNELAKKYQHNKIPEHEDYEAFENGSIWSWKQYKFKNQRKGKDGYFKVGLMIDKKRSFDFMVSRLIASTFDDRPIEQLDQLDCHHCNKISLDNSVSNLVFLPQELHDIMHKKLTNEQILLIGQQVKHLRGSAKTDLFCKLIKQELNK